MVAIMIITKIKQIRSAYYHDYKYISMHYNSNILKLLGM
jgi:hypothetical protein